jgi:PadR family transcriptional regulator PadR
MDSQLKRGLLDVCVLKVLSFGESYGYKIIKDLSAENVDISESTLYPILKRLEAEECLSVHSAEHSGRLRKYYSITTKGSERIAEFLADWQQVMTIYEFIKGGQNDDKLNQE